MKLKNRPVTIGGPSGPIDILRNRHGIPEISGRSQADLAYGLGWVHASDRQLQALLTRVLLQGQAAEKLAADPALIEIDRYMRRMNFLPDPGTEMTRLEPAVRTWLGAYADGFNAGLDENGTVFELKLLGYRPDPWQIKDSLRIGNVFGFLGLADAQGSMEKLLIEMIRHDVGEARLRELFPYLTDEIDADLIKKVTLSPPLVPAAIRWLQKLPKFAASNNWAVSGSRTASGKPILCNDPHLEVNRLPAVWQEVVMRLPDNDLLGVTIPGVPGLILGRNRDVSWGATYSFMDMIDYKVEHCRDGKYRRGEAWLPFDVREEVIRVKKGEPVVERVYENDNGLLEGDPGREGYCLVMMWSGARDCGAAEFNTIYRIGTARSVREGMDCLRALDAPTFNWVLADREGHIGYQMSGRLYRRPEGVSGLVPLPAWEKRYDYPGYVDKALLPSLYDPQEGIIVTANNDLNHLGRCRPINLPMGAYRAERIEERLLAAGTLTAQEMQAIHFDLYSRQAERLMAVIRPLLPATENGKTLKDWDCTYDADSRGAMLFESVYQSLLRVVFGDLGLGRETVDHLMKETSIFNDYYANFDNVLLREESAWFEGQSREDLFRRAVGEGLAVEAVPYGQTRQIVLSHLLFGGKLPRFLGFDVGPFALPGNRATVHQGQIFRSAGRLTTFSPSYRMIADMAGSELLTTLAGGPTDRRFSPWYTSDLQNWRQGIYKSLK
jgi:penicillin G amidase